MQVDLVHPRPLRVLDLQRVDDQVGAAVGEPAFYARDCVVPPDAALDPLAEIPDRDQKLMVFTGIERAKFRKPVTPGDQLRVEVDVLAWRTTAVRMQGNVWVDGKLACEAVVTCQLVSRPA